MTTLFGLNSKSADWRAGCLYRLDTELMPPGYDPNVCGTRSLSQEIISRASTAGEVVDLIAAESKYINIAIWIAINALDMCDTELRERILRVVAASDPGTACCIWLRVPLTDSEAQILAEAFIPRMPVMARKIASGAVTRARSL